MQLIFLIKSYVATVQRAYREGNLQHRNSTDHGHAFSSQVEIAKESIALNNRK